MTNTQFNALMAELREVRTALDRFGARVDSMLGPMQAPYQATGVGRLAEENAAEDLANAFGPRDPITGDPVPVQRGGKRAGKRGRK